MRLIRSGADRFQRFDPFIMAGASIEFCFFGFGGGTDFGLYGRAGNGRKMPGLMIGTARGASSSPDTVFDDRFWHGTR